MKIHKLKRLVIFCRYIDKEVEHLSNIKEFT
jgi:hypothetical protein